MSLIQKSLRSAAAALTFGSAVAATTVPACALDDKTCDALSRRAKFAPGEVDISGQPLGGQPTAGHIFPYSRTYKVQFRDGSIHNVRGANDKDATDPRLGDGTRANNTLHLRHCEP